MKLDLNCQEVSRMLSDGQDAKLPAADRARFRLHLVLCATCRDVSEQMDFLRRAMHAMHQEMPDGHGHPQPNHTDNTDRDDDPATRSDDPGASAD